MADRQQVTLGLDRQRVVCRLGSLAPRFNANRPKALAKNLLHLQLPDLGVQLIHPRLASSLSAIGRTFEPTASPSMARRIQAAIIMWRTP
jgi:hypothetical protein